MFKMINMKFMISKINKKDIIVYALLLGIIIFSAILRILPMFWGVYLDEFDPYIHYKGAMYILENGFSSWFSWFDPTRWAPWGTDVPSQAQLGPPFTGAIFYLFLKQIGINISLMEALAIFPVISGAILTFLIYILGKELINRYAGLFAAFVFAIDPTSLQRTGFGFFDTEATGLLGMLLSIIFFIKALEKRTIPYAIISGLSLAYMTLCWGAYLYPLNLFALYTILMVIIGRWSKQLSLTITIVSSITIFAMALAPNIGLSTAISPSTAAPIFAFILCLIMSFTSYIEDINLRRKVSIGSVIFIIVIAIIVVFSGLLGPIAGKFLVFINPFVRTEAPIISTVGEQFPATWATFFSNYHILTILAPAGAYFAIKRANNKDIFIVLFALMAIYGAANYVRLLIIVAPSLAILSALALDSILSHIFTKKEETKSKKARIRQLGKIYAIILIVIVAIGFIPAVNATRLANRPVMLLSSATGAATVVTDWIDALNWMRDNIPYNSIVGCWWDYGYWINVVANKSVIADNSTTNSTQIKLIAEAFLNDEEYALNIFKAMRVEYVVVYEPWILLKTEPQIALPPWSVIGDFEKSTAMMAIAGYNTSDYIATLPLNIGGKVMNWPLPIGPKAQNTLLYQLLFYPFREGYRQLLGINIEEPKYFQLVYHSNNYWVLIYKINYPDLESH
ncbi:MAG: glycosyltransferase family 39 protein [Candidatus Methanomethylicia archaeon]|nr:glycosyltransferase family 39 protein [Candidatus Methanomethylicia archaeon]